MLLRPNEQASHRTALLAWLAVGALLRFAYLQEQALTSVLFFQPLLDEEEMRNAAEGLLRGEGFGSQPLFKAPLYPILLAGVMAVTGEGWYWAMRFLQHAAGVVLIAIGWDTAKRLLPPGRASFLAANVAAGVLAVYAPLIRLENQLILDSLVVFLQSALLWTLLRMRLSGGSRAAILWAAGAGVLTALAWLNRPTITPVIPFLALWIVGLAALRTHWSSRALRRRFAQACVFLLFPILAVSGFGLRNYVVSGELMFLPWQGSFNFYEANKPGASGRYFLQPGFVVTHGGNPTEVLAVQGYERATAHELVRAPERLGTYQRVDWYWRTTSLRAISNPWSRWLKLMARKTVYLGTDKEIFNFEEYEIHKRSSWVLRWLPLSFGMVFPLSLASLAFVTFLSRGRRDFIVLLWLYAILLGGAIALYFTSGRLRMPLVFPAVILASFFIAEGAEWIRLQRTQRSGHLRLGVIALLLVAGVAWSWGDWWGVRSERLHHADYERMSNAAFRAGEPERALEYANRAAAERPDSPVVPMLRGNALFELGRLDEAEQAFRFATDAIRSDAVAPFNLGILLYYERNDPAEARGFFEEAVSRNPNYIRARAMEALCAIRLGDLESAEILLEPLLALAEPPPDRTLLHAIIALHTAQRDEIAAARAMQRLTAIFGEAAAQRAHEEMRIAGILEQ